MKERRIYTEELPLFKQRTLHPCATRDAAGCQELYKLLQKLVVGILREFISSEQIV